MSNSSVYRFEICFPPNERSYCGKFLDSEETFEEAARKAEEWDGSSVEVFDLELDACESELLDVLFTLNCYMDMSQLEDLLCNIITCAFNAGIRHAAKK
jgi:hypothetical protein